MVLKRFLKRAPDPAASPHAIPAGERVYAVGDIHGRRDLLDMLLAQIEADDAARGPARTTLVFLGDLVDRGADSSGVVQRLLDLSRSGRSARFLMGNHEETFVKAARGDAAALRYLVRYGGRETVLSYGIGTAAYNAADFDELAAMLAARVPGAHIDFIEAFEDQVAIGDYLFVHAGVRPGTPIAEQKASDLRWIRSEFLDYRGSHGPMVVHGHTITDEVDEQPNRIGIDTGAFASDRLTAIGLEGTNRWYLAT